MEDWAKMQKKKINLINVKLREHFRYIRSEYINIKQFYKNVEDSKNNYKKSSQKLTEKKEKLYEEKKIDDLGLKKDDLKKSKTKEETIEKMLPEETKKVMDKKKIYGCYLNSFIDEYKNIESLNSKRHKEMVVSFIKEMSNNIINFHVSLNGIIGFLDSLKEEVFMN